MIKIDVISNTLIISLDGEIDDHVAKSVRDKIDYVLLRKGIKNIIFDLSEIVFMDSSGIGLLMGRYRLLCQRKGKSAIVCTNRQVLKILKMSGILKLFKLYDDVDTAINSITSSVII